MDKDVYRPILAPFGGDGRRLAIKRRLDVGCPQSRAIMWESRWDADMSEASKAAASLAQLGFADAQALGKKVMISFSQPEATSGV